MSEGCNYLIYKGVVDIMHRVNLFKLRFYLMIVVILVLPFFTFAERIGVAIIYNSKTADLLGEENYRAMITKAEKTFTDNYVTAIVVDTEDVVENVLDYFEIAVLLSDSELTSQTADKLADFVLQGGKIAATYNTNYFENLGITSTNNTASQLTLKLDDLTLTSTKTLLVNGKPDSEILSWTGSNYAAVVKTSTSFYLAEELFTSKEPTDWETFFVDEIYYMLETPSLMFSLSLPEIKELYKTVNDRFLVCQKLIKKLNKENLTTEEQAALFAEATESREALRYFLAKESAGHATYFLSKLKSRSDALFPLIHPLKTPADELLKRGEYWYKKVNTFSLEKVPENAFLFIGDSITDGYYLQGYLAGIPTINRGISADIAGGVYTRRILFNLESKPKAALLMIGTNNVNCNLELDTYFDDVQKILEYLQTNAPQAKLYLQSILPLGKDWPAAPEVRSYNQKLEALAQSLGVEYLDIYSLFEEDDYLPASLSEDGVHPNGRAYQIWSDFLLKRFKADGLI